MTNIVLCPNCHGCQHVSKPPMIAGDVHGSYGSSGTETYPCPVCNGEGWVDSDADSDIAAMKTIVLSAFETLENLMDECAKRGEQIKELRATIDSVPNVQYIVSVDPVYESAVSERIEELEAKVKSFRSNNRDLKTIAANSESYTHRVDELLGGCKSDVKQRDKRIKEPEAQVESLIDQNETIREQRDWATMNYRDKHDLGLLDELLKIVNPILRDGWKDTPYSDLGEDMESILCTVERYRRKHHIVG